MHRGSWPLLVLLFVVGHTGQHGNPAYVDGQLARLRYRSEG